MRRIFLTAAALIVAAATAVAADPVKVGVIGPFSGPFALQGKNFKAGIEAYMALNGDSPGGHKVEILYRDVPQANPAQAKALAQELIVADGVQYLAGFYFTPDAMAVTPLLAQGNVPMVVMNAATSAIVTKSPLVVRTSFTMWQNSVPMAKVARERGIGKVVIAVSDYGPGLDAEKAFRTTFENAGGTVVDAIRMPLSTADFSPIMQRIKDSGADAVFAFLPSGPTTLGFLKAYAENGLRQASMELLATGDLTPESDLPALGDAALGVLTTYHYSVAHDSPENRAFVAAAAKAIGGRGELSAPAAGAFDGMRLIYRMIEATDGVKDAQKAVDAVKGLSWLSPRGPVTLDPRSRHLTQNVYLREVAKAADGTYENREIATFEAQGDPGLDAPK